MKIEEIVEVYALISQNEENIFSHSASISLRKKSFKNLTSNLVKLAFDTRRVDQEVNYIARRGLQNYNRSDQFITEATIDKLKSLKKIKDILDSIKMSFGKNPAWQDSYCRVLFDTINRALRTDQKDGDYTDNQPGVGSIDYIEEMLFVRYRLVLNNILGMSDKVIKNKLLEKDPELVNPDINNVVSVSKEEVGRETYDTLLEKLFGGVAATKENPEVERTVTITIKDKFLE